MLKRTFVTLAAATVLATAARAEAAAKTGYAEINGLKYYYEITGQGDPLLFLHGGLFAIDMYPQLRGALAKHRQVIAVDLHGHGHTALGTRDFSTVDQGTDMAALVKSLGFSQVDVVGHSMGGAVGFQFAAQNPALVRRLTLVSAVYAQDGFFPEMLPMQAQVSAAMMPMMKETPMYKSYIAVAPKPQEFPRLLDQMGAYMRKSYDWSADVAKLTMPVMLVFGDSDMIRPEHMVKFYHLLGGGLKDAGWMRENMSKNRLAILPDVTHYDMAFAPQLPRTLQPFLDGKSGPQQWAE
jgi:pimeloyl-ACP methyl ester carboxylesterase